jgi:membrane protein
MYFSIMSFAGLLRKIQADRLATQSAAIAFYMALAFAPICILILTALASLNIGAQEELIFEVRRLLGPETESIVEVVLKTVKSRPNLTSIAGWGSFIALLISASIVFNQFKVTLNIIFDNTRGPTEAPVTFFRELRILLLDRLLTIGFVLGFIVLSITSLILSSILTGLIRTTPLPAVASILNEVVSALVFSVIFSLVFRCLPKRPTNWKNSFLGGLCTGALFTVGKILIGLYLNQAAIGSAYGAAGSLLVFLVWVYYSSLIIFVGAEIAAFFKERSSAPTRLEFRSQIR